LAVRAVGRKNQSDPSDQSDSNAYTHWLTHREVAVVANTIICLIHQANYLLDQQVAALERDFIQEGGYSEKLAAARMAHRRTQDQPRASVQSDRSNPSDPPEVSPPLPSCPLCAKPMALRTARQGARSGSQFLGCTAYPDCKGTRPLA